MLPRDRRIALLRIAAIAAIAFFAMALFVTLTRQQPDAFPRLIEQEFASTLPVDLTYRVAAALQSGYTPRLHSFGRTLEEFCVLLYERLAYQPSALAGTARAKLAVIYGERGFRRQAREMASSVPASASTLVRVAVLIGWVYGDGPRPPDLQAAIADLEILDPWFARLCRLRVAERLGQTARAQRIRSEIKRYELTVLTGAAIVAALWSVVLLVGVAALAWWLLRWFFTPSPELPVRPPPLVRPWHPLDALELAAVMIALVVASKLAGSAAAARLPRTDVWQLVVDAAAYLGAALLGLLWIRTRLRSQPVGLSHFLGLSAPAVRGVALGVACYGAFIAAIAAALAAGAYLTGATLAAAGARGAFPAEALRNPVAAAGYAALAVLVAPVVEEVIFRGFIYAGFRRRLAVGPAALASGALFALAHISLPLPAKIGIALLGAVLAYAYERTRNLWVAIGMHMTHNALVFAVLLLAAL